MSTIHTAIRPIDRALTTKPWVASISTLYTHHLDGDDPNDPLHPAHYFAIPPQQRRTPPGSLTGLPAASLSLTSHRVVAARRRQPTPPAGPASDASTTPSTTPNTTPPTTPSTTPSNPFERRQAELERYTWATRLALWRSLQSDNVGNELLVLPSRYCVWKQLTRDRPVCLAKLSIVQPRKPERPGQPHYLANEGIVFGKALTEGDMGYAVILNPPTTESELAGQPCKDGIITVWDWPEFEEYIRMVYL